MLSPLPRSFPGLVHEMSTKATLEDSILTAALLVDHLDVGFIAPAHQRVSELLRGCVSKSLREQRNSAVSQKKGDVVRTACYKAQDIPETPMYYREEETKCNKPTVRTSRQLRPICSWSGASGRNRTARA